MVIDKSRVMQQYFTVFWAKRKAGIFTGFNLLPYHLVVHAQSIFINNSVVQTLITLPSPEVLPHQGRLIVPNAPMCRPHRPQPNVWHTASAENLM